MRKDRTVGVERILHPRCTKRNAAVVRLTLDNGEQLVCTPDHKFMLRDGTYKPAAELQTTDSLMPLYRKLSSTKEKSITIEGYEMVWSPRSDSWLFTHLVADWYNRWKGVYAESEGEHCHHKDFNKRNNNPTNLQRLEKEAHLALHREHVSKTLHRPEVIEAGRKLRQSDAFRQKMSVRMQEPQTRETLSVQAKMQWENEAYKSFMQESWRTFYESNPEYQASNHAQLDAAQRSYWSDEENRKQQSERTRAHFQNNPDARERHSEEAKLQWADSELRTWRADKTREQWTPEFREKRKATLAQTYYQKSLTALKTCGGDADAYQRLRTETRDRSLLRLDTLCERYFEGKPERMQEALGHFNHRIVSIESLEEAVDVYDIEVPGTHNFALESGVFVHNSAKQGRDRRTQAVLPLRGKILCVEKARVDRALDNDGIKQLIMAIGTGLALSTSQDEEKDKGNNFDLAKLRYHKIIIMADADVDGDHIRTLLLNFFYRYMKPLVDSGHIYVAQPPLYSIRIGKDQKVYARTEADRDRIIKEIKKRDTHVTRFKGLGEMNPDDLADTTMNPANRTLAQVTVEEAAEADQMFTVLLGDKVEPRRAFIEKYAKEVKNLDFV